MDACYVGVALGADGNAAVACAGEGTAEIQCSPIGVAGVDARIVSLLRGRPARVRVEGPASTALEVALRLARLPVAEVTVLRSSNRRAEPAPRRAARLAAEARRAA